MLKPMMLLVPAVLLFGYCPASIAAPVPQAGTSASASNSSKAGEVPTHVKKIYEVDCAMCHGANGNGKTDLAADMKLQLDDWTNPSALASKTDQQLFSLIRQGKDKMPPEAEGRLKNEDLHTLISYIRNMSKGAPAVPAAPETPATAPAAPSGPSTR